MMPTLVKRNRKAYLVFSDTDYSEPRIVSTYYEIAIDPDIIPDDVVVRQLVRAYYFSNGYRDIALSIPDYPTFVEFTPIKPPRKTGYRWHNGSWQK